MPSAMAMWTPANTSAEQNHDDDQIMSLPPNMSVFP